jgi:hypothetical protein
MRYACRFARCFAGVAELVDAPDLKTKEIILRIQYYQVYSVI